MTSQAYMNNINDKLLKQHDNQLTQVDSVSEVADEDVNVKTYEDLNQDQYDPILTANLDGIEEPTSNGESD